LKSYRKNVPHDGPDFAIIAGSMKNSKERIATTEITEECSVFSTDRMMRRTE
jgi:hypothetical protein